MISRTSVQRACDSQTRRCEMSDNGKGDAEKARYWQRTISEAVQSGISIRQFCRQRRLKESQFYWWQHKLRARRQAGTTSKSGGQGRPTSFALVDRKSTRLNSSHLGISYAVF